MADKVTALGADVVGVTVGARIVGQSNQTIDDSWKQQRLNQDFSDAMQKSLSGAEQASRKPAGLKSSVETALSRISALADEAEKAGAQLYGGLPPGGVGQAQTATCISETIARFEDQIDRLTQAVRRISSGL